MVSTLDWNGKLGEMWANKVEAHDRLLGPIGDVGIALLGDIKGKRILDIGCGAGATSLAMAAAGAQVVGVDISENLLAKAKERDLENACTFLLSDAATTDFGEPFDLIYSRFGAMFFPDPVEAWTRLRDQIVSGGKAVHVCWRDASLNEWVTFPLEAVASILGDEDTKVSPSGVPGPFVWADQAVFTDIFEKSGWEVSAEQVSGDILIGAGHNAVADAVQYAMQVGPLGSRIKTLEPDMRNAVMSSLENAMKSKLVNGQIRLKTEGWAITATA